MKISKSKQELARIISENGGWRDGDFAAQDKDLWVCFYKGKPTRCGDYWEDKGDCQYRFGFTQDNTLPNWHQTVLSSAEYSHLYPATDADGWIEWNGGECPVDEYCMVDYRMSATPYGYHLTNQACNLAWDGVEKPYCIIAYRPHKPEQAKSTAVGDDETNLAAKEELEAMEYKPSIEQLMQTYADRAHSLQLANEHLATCTKQANEAMKALSIACKAAGFDISPITAKQEPELVITDWRDLQVGDEVECVKVNKAGDNYADEYLGKVGVVIKTEPPMLANQAVRLKFFDGKEYWISEWRFIRRP